MADDASKPPAAVPPAAAADTVTVASHVHTAIRIAEQPADPEKPGSAPPLKSAVIAGAAHPGGPPGITRGVNAKMFRDWHGAVKGLHSPLADLVSEVPANYVPPPVSHGFEPALKAAAADAQARARSQAQPQAQPQAQAPVPAQAPAAPPAPAATPVPATASGVAPAAKK